MCLEEEIYSLPEVFIFFLADPAPGECGDLGLLGLTGSLSPPASSLLLNMAICLNVSLIVFLVSLNILFLSLLFCEQILAVWNETLALGLF